MRHYLRNSEGEVWDVSRGWHDKDTETCYFSANSYISLEHLLKHYFDNFMENVCRFPIFSESEGLHVYVTLEED